MIAKIMESSGSFHAVYYNEHKVEQQKAELLMASNFGEQLSSSDFQSREDYLRKFNEVSNQNPRVKRRQFHAVISTKGKAHNAEELKTIAAEYMKRMGYGENPYLVYFHKDTPNNHVHIISTRVGVDGKLVKDSHERRESLRHIRDIMQQIPHRELDGRNIVHEVMQYRFSTEAQLKLLLEHKGYTTQSDASRDLLILRGKYLTARITRQVLLEKLKDKPDVERIKQLKAIFHKYREGRSVEGFEQELKHKFGVQLVFHRNGGHERPYGYTVMDHATKQIYKGSDILKISELLRDRNGVEEDNPHIQSLKELQNDKRLKAIFKAKSPQYHCCVTEY